jgi:hypothetical protein
VWHFTQTRLSLPAAAAALGERWCMPAIAPVAAATLAWEALLHGALLLIVRFTRGPISAGYPAEARRLGATWADSGPLAG